MARGVIQKYVVKMILNNGSTSSGAIKTVGIQVGSNANKISPTNYAGNDGSAINTGREKIRAICTAVAACLSKTLFSIEEAAYSDIVS